MNWIKVREKLENTKRIITLVGSVEENQANRIKQKIIESNLISETEEIILAIDSGGGSLVDGLGIYDVIKLSLAPVIGVVIGACKSTATLILQACDKRISMRHSTFLIHYPSIKIEICLEEGWEKELLEYVKQSKLKRERSEQIYLSRTKMTPEQLHQSLLKGNKRFGEIDPEQALELGLIDQIVDNYDLFGPRPNPNLEK